MKSLYHMFPFTCFLLLLLVSFEEMEAEEESKYITVSGKTDGFGAQLSAVMSGIAYAHATQKIYVHTPFTSMEHSAGYGSKRKFAALMDVFANMGFNSPRIDEIKEPVECRKYFHDLIKNHDEYYTEDVRCLLREKYYAKNHNLKTTYHKIDPLTLVIAFHIRRGDIGPHFEKRYTDDSRYLKAMEFLSKNYIEHKLSFHIYSEGAEKDFARYIDKGIKLERSVTLHLNEDVRLTFNDLVHADVLVLANSAFSASAALLSLGEIYMISGSRYLPSPRLKTWHLFPF